MFWPVIFIMFPVLLSVIVGCGGEATAPGEPATSGEAAASGEAAIGDASTADAFFSVGEIVAYWSRYYALQPGDVLTLGSPGGIGFARTPHRFLRHDDEVVVDIAGIGRLTNRVLQPGA